LVVGLTGGIASGKSAAADEFARLGVTVVDTDLLAREVVVPGSPGLAEIVAHFGAAVLDGAGQLDRRQLRTRIFADPAERLVLEAITHPRIRELALAAVRQSQSSYTLVVVPLLAEKGRYAFIDRVLLIDVDPHVQLQRLQSRDALERQLAEKMIAAQATRQQRLAIADDVIDNSADLATLYARVALQHQRYLQLANSANK
jgi:dephospho-CoA kinase